MSKARLIAYILLCLGFLTLVHQYVFYGVWFEIKDIHHETFSVAFFSLSLGILLGAFEKSGKP
jgi:hypothetical protein